jgi:NAD(P)-dependent dehydrogenase (short-subunit alcohol dehydrogenase family)
MNGKVAIVTGASRGIGRAIAGNLARRGAAVVGIARNAEQLELTRRTIGTENGIFRPYIADVTSAKEVDEAVGTVIDIFGRVDILVNNAGICIRGAFDELSTREYDHLIASNVNSVVYCSQSVWEPMKAAGGGLIINVSSLVAAAPTRGFAVYAATKGFVNSLTAALAAEGHRDGIRAYAVAPGYVRTGLFRSVSPEIPEDKALSPEDVAAAVDLLCSSEYQYSAGSVLSMRH